MKITEVLRDSKPRIKSLIAYLDENGQLVSATDGLLIESGSLKATPFEFNLVEPTFDVISCALRAIYGSGGDLDVAGSGKVCFDACYDGNQGSLEEIQKYTVLYTSLCMKTYHEVVDIAHIEYKKK